MLSCYLRFPIVIIEIVVIYYSRVILPICQKYLAVIFIGNLLYMQKRE